MSADSIDETQAAPPLPSSTPRPLVGERYEILGLLGAGGMGNVYKAKDLELDELVALKVLRPELLGEPDAQERFRREVKLARRVTHPNVARVFDIGERGGDRILTMELVDGEPVSARVAREGALPIAVVIDIASAICAGLGAAHAAGVIHRDLKPDNVLLEKGGRVVLTDFGIARAAVAGSAVATGTFIGTPAYMAPEQIAGAAIDARTDLYALGAMLFELSTGECPWQGETVFAIAAARLLHPPPDPRRRRPDLPASLAALILRCMARRPEERFASAAEVAAALAAVTLPAPASSAAARLLHPPAVSVQREGAQKGDKLVAVLPFRNAGAPEQAYVAEGLTEDVIDQLSMVPGLRVRSRGVVMRFRGVESDPREIGRELGVQVVVEGSVRRTSEGVRISARLASVADGVQLWARRFDRPFAELLQVSDDVARAIAEALTVTVGDAGAAPRAAEGDAEAMDLYLRARAASHDLFDHVGETALPLFERAMARAPDDPRILAGYAMVRARVWSADPDAARSAAAAAARAVELAPGLPHAHAALAAVSFQAGEEIAPVRSLKHALRLSPDNVDAHDLLGRILSETALLADARRHLVKALALDPESALARLCLARTCEILGEHDEVDRLLAARPERTIRTLARVLVWRRDAVRAAEVLRDPTASGPISLRTRGLLELATGGPPPYVWSARFNDQATPRLSAFFLQTEAESAAFVGDRDRVLAIIACAAEGTLYDIAWLDGCPLLAPVRAEPAFLAARAKVAARADRVAAAYLAAF
jgi:TolB-like protein